MSQSFRMLYKTKAYHETSQECLFTCKKTGLNIAAGNILLQENSFYDIMVIVSTTPILLWELIFLFPIIKTICRFGRRGENIRCSG